MKFVFYQSLTDEAKAAVTEAHRRATDPRAPEAGRPVGFVGGEARYDGGSMYITTTCGKMHVVIGWKTPGKVLPVVEGVENG